MNFTFVCAKSVLILHVHKKTQLEGKNVILWSPSEHLQIVNNPSPDFTAALWFVFMGYLLNYFLTKEGN